MSAAKYTDAQAVDAITAIVNAAPRKPMPTVEEIQKVHREFWPSPPVTPGKPDIAMVGRILDEVHEAEQKARDTKKTKPGAAARRAHGDKTRALVLAEAAKLPERITKKSDAARWIRKQLGYPKTPGLDRIETILGEKGLPKPAK
jgi:hypothetical protein